MRLTSANHPRGILTGIGLLVVGAILAGCVTSAGAKQQEVPKKFTPPFAYGSGTFDAFVKESYEYCKVGDITPFKTWMETAYAKFREEVEPSRPEKLADYLAAVKKELSAIKDPTERATAQQKQGEKFWKFIKINIKNYSLTRGFEYAYTVKYNNRQCFLGAITIASLLQECGIDAGVIMIGRNAVGHETNLGHAVVLIKLPNEEDVVIDASEPTPVFMHMGVYAVAGTPQFMEPQYEKKTGRITSYRSLVTHDNLEPFQVKTLDLSFVKSQFWYYRGERAIGGITADRMTRKGLLASKDALTKSLELCSTNPLSRFMLARTDFELGDLDESYAQLQAAVGEYTRAGWVPGDVRQFARAVDAQRGPPAAIDR